MSTDEKTITMKDGIEYVPTPEMAQEISSRAASPNTAESRGSSPQSALNRNSAFDVPPLSLRRAAELCPNLCHAPSNLQGIPYGCLLGQGPVTWDRRHTGDGPSRCVVLCDGKECAALLRLNPSLRPDGPKAA